MSEMTGIVELQEKVSGKGNKFFSIKVAGQYVGNAYSSVVKDLQTGDYVRVSYETKGNFKNVTKLEKIDESQVANVETTVITTPKEVPYPKGYRPSPEVINERALYLAQLFVNSQEETKKLTKKSLMTRLSVAFEIANPIREWLVNGVKPDGTEVLCDED